MPDPGESGTTDPARLELAARVIAAVSAKPETAKRLSQIDVADVHNASVILAGDSEVIQLGEQPKAAPPQAAQRAEIEKRFATARKDFAAGRYAEAGDGFAFVVAQDPSGPHAGPAQWNLTRSRLRRPCRSLP